MFLANAYGPGSARPRRSRSGPAVVIGSLLAALVLADSARAEHRELDLVSTGPDGGNLDVGAAFLDASTDGARVFFETDEALVSADTDTFSDIYERAGGQTTLVSTGTELSARFEGTSDDGSQSSWRHWSRC